MKTTESAPDQRLREAQEALELARQGRENSACPEDHAYDVGLLERALDGFRAAAAAASQGESRLEALALLGQADVLLLLPVDAPHQCDRLHQIAALSGSALERLDSAVDRVEALRGFLLLSEASRHLAARETPVEGERRLRRTSALLAGAAHVARELDRPDWIARVDAESCRVMSERFLPDRDEALLDALRFGEQAVEVWRGLSGARGFELPELLHHLGNCCMKVGGERARWLRQGRAWYREGAGCVGAERYPRLRRMLEEHAAMAEALLSNEDHSLPEKEMMARYRSRIQVALDTGEIDEARRLGWGCLAWAWSLPQTPNVAIGQAHRMLADIALSQRAADEAQHHLYHAIGVLTPILPDSHPLRSLLVEARAKLGEVLRMTGKEGEVEGWLERASQAFVQAEAACQQGSRLVEAQPEAALPAFEWALNAFPCHPAARFYRGLVRMMRGDHRGALEDYNAFLTLKPKSLRAYVNRANVKARIGDLDGAQADLDEALKVDPRDLIVRRMRAQLFEARGQPDRAAEECEEALKSTEDPELRGALERHLAQLRQAAGK